LLHNTAFSTGIRLTIEMRPPVPTLAYRSHSSNVRRTWCSYLEVKRRDDHKSGLFMKPWHKINEL